jgi:hypothetical protein
MAEMETARTVGGGKRSGLVISLRSLYAHSAREVTNRKRTRAIFPQTWAWYLFQSMCLGRHKILADGRGFRRREAIT